MAERQEGSSQVSPQPSGDPPLTPPRTVETMFGWWATYPEKEGAQLTRGNFPGLRMPRLDRRITYGKHKLTIPSL